MEYLIIVETDITKVSWVQKYLVEVTPLVMAYGGCYITRSSAVEFLKGERGSTRHSNRAVRQVGTIGSLSGYSAALDRSADERS